MTENHTLPDALDLDAGRALVSLARRTIERCVEADEVPAGKPESPHDALSEPGGAFVTIERDDTLRGCCGRVESTAPLGSVVGDVAVDAARHDPRCPPVGPAELDEVTVTVTALAAPTTLPGSSPDQYPDVVDVGRHGLLVTHEPNRGVLLPQVAVDRGWDSETFLAATCRKAGLPGDAWRHPDVDVERFTARSFLECSPRGGICERRFDERDTEITECVAPDDGVLPDGKPMTDGGHPGAGNRTPAVAGQFYASSAVDLREQLADCFDHDLGPGPLATATRDGTADVLGIVSPHAGYPFSGPVAAHGFVSLAATDPETVVVLGPNHRGRGADAAVAPHDEWQTPLGSMPVDADLASAIVKESDVATYDDRTHAGEHSIEVQLPFVQYCLTDASIVPICLTRLGDENARRLGRAVAAAIERTDRSVALVSSTDLTHYDPHEVAVRSDESIVEAIEHLSTDAIATAVGDGHSMCGPWATVAGLTAATELGATAGDCLKYATSAQTGGEKHQVVGYCSATLRR